jgi:hypothetical protein
MLSFRTVDCTEHAGVYSPFKRRILMGILTSFFKPKKWLRSLKGTPGQGRMPGKSENTEKQNKINTLSTKGTKIQKLKYSKCIYIKTKKINKKYMQYCNKKIHTVL